MRFILPCELRMDWFFHDGSVLFLSKSRKAWEWEKAKGYARALALSSSGPTVHKTARLECKDAYTPITMRTKIMYINGGCLIGSWTITRLKLTLMIGCTKDTQPNIVWEKNNFLYCWREKRNLSIKSSKMLRVGKKIKIKN